MNIYSLLVPRTYAIIREIHTRFYTDTLPEFINKQPYNRRTANFMIRKALENL